MALVCYLQAAHPALRQSPDLRLFLQSDETEFAIEASRTAAEVGEAAPAASGGAANVARKTLSGAARLFKALGQSAAVIQAPASVRMADEDESPEYLRVRAYLSELESHLTETHKQAERLVRRHGSLAAALAEFGAAMASLGRQQAEERAGGGGVPQSFARLAERAAAAATVCRRSQDELARSFEAPLKEAARWVRAAKKAMEARSEALAARGAARSDVDAKRTRLARLRGTPGMREERVMEAERDLQAAHAKAEATAQAYAAIVQRMDADLGRFQSERVEEFEYILRDFAEAERRTSEEVAGLWRALAAEA